MPKTKIVKKKIDAKATQKVEVPAPKLAVMEKNETGECLDKIRAILNGTILRQQMGISADKNPTSYATLRVGLLAIAKEVSAIEK